MKSNRTHSSHSESGLLSTIPERIRAHPDDSWSETTQPIVEMSDCRIDASLLCLVLAFDRLRPTSPPAWFVSDSQAIIVGRGATTEFDVEAQRILVRDRSISAQHFTLRREGNGYQLIDHGSMNGTFVNNVRITCQALHDGDVIEAGASYFVVSHVPVGMLGAMRQLSPHASTGLDSLVPALADEFARVDRLARSDVPIHISGETGTGKEVVAREIHRRSGRVGRFVGVNCGAIPDALITSELFGAKRGAYSSAATDREGLIRASDRGTLFLDEIAELSLSSQAALLRVLQEREVTPVGGTAPERCDLRVISATNKDLDACCDDGSFRRDLHARLCGADVILPPLRYRRSDLGLLIGRLLFQLCEGRDVTFTRAAARALFAYNWRYNIRELQRALDLAISAFEQDQRVLQISDKHLPPAIQAAIQEASKSDSTRFRDLASEHAGNVTALSRALGTSRSHVRRLAQRYGCNLDAFRTSS
jgi:transcriptional regulator of aromatic amino acid metabolism